MISLSSLLRYDVKMPNFTFCGERKQGTTKFSFSFCRNVVVVLRNSSLGEFAYIWQSKWLGEITMKIERTRILFLSDFFAASAVLRSWLSATDTTTSSIVGLTMLGFVACAFAVVRKRTQQLPTTRNRVYKRTQHLTSNNVASVYTGLYHPNKWYAQSFCKKR